MRIRQTLLIFGALAMLAGACGDDDTSTADTVVDAPDVTASDADEDETDALCRRYDTFVADQTPGAARDFLENDADSMPTGVFGTVTDVADGIDADIENVVGYFGAVCDPGSVDDAVEDPAFDDPVIDDDPASPPPADEDFGEEFEGTTDTEEDRAARNEPPVAFEGACLGLFDVWAEGDRPAASRFGDEAVIDVLFSRRFSPPAGSGVRLSDVGDCFYEIPSGVAEIAIADSDVEAFVVEVTWYDSDDFFADPDRRARFEAAT